MRYPSTHTAETRQRIIGEAARRFRKDGVAGTGLVPLMKALGLTHGGFYAHFPSKEALVEAALLAAAGQVVELSRDLGDAARLRDFLAFYLSPVHRDAPDDGCPLPSLCAELGLRGTPSRTTDAIVAHLDAQLGPCAVASADEDGGLVTLAALVGAVTLARAVADPATSTRILGAVHAAIRVPEAQG